MALKTLSINDVDLSTFGIFLQSETYLSAPSFDYVEYAVPARDGNLLSYNKRMNNIIRRFDCLIKDNVQSGMDALKNLIYSNAGYLKLATSYEPDVYQEGYLAQEIEVTPFMKDSALSAQFSLYFSCKPQKYFNTTASGSYEPAVSVTIPNLIGIYSRNDEKITDIFAKLHAYEIPDDEYFLVFKIYDAFSSDSSGVTFTNVTGTNSSGGFIALADYAGINDEDFDLIAAKASTAGYYNYGTVNTWDDYLMVEMIVPYSSGATYSFTCTHEGTAHNGQTIMSDYSVTLTNTAAVGADVVALGITAQAQEMEDTTVLGVDGHFYIEGRKDGTRKFGAHLMIPFGSLTGAQIAALTQLIETDMYKGTDAFVLDIDNDLNATSGGYKAGHLIEVDGDLSGICDEYSFTMLKAETTAERYAGQPLAISAEVRWWKV